MPLIRMSELLGEAEKEGRAVAALNVGNLEMILGVIRAAEDTGMPVILQIAEKRLGTSPLAVIGPAMVAAARGARVPIAVHLDHGLTMSTVREALALGFTSVMLDGSALPYEENIALTREAAQAAHAAGADCEGELGRVERGEDGSNTPSECVDPDQCERFARETGVDALAVGIGNAHGVYEAAPALRFDILAAVRAACPVPLVLHGGTGLSERDFERAVQGGVRKINIATALFMAVAQAARGDGEQPFFTLSAAMAEAARREAVRHIQLFSR